MEHQSMEGYFEYIHDKTYIDKYPGSIITLEELKNKRIVEFGSGVGNDIRYLIEKKFDPADLYLIECDPWYFVDAMDNLEGLFGFYFHNGHHFSLCEDVLDNHYPDGFTDFVYANNFLHCMKMKSPKEESYLLSYELSLKYGWRIREEWVEVAMMKPKEKIAKVIEEAYRLLKNKGVFFGRTLSNKIDFDVLEKLEKKNRNEKEEFVLKTVKALQDGQLVGLCPEDLESFAKKSGFSRAYSEIKPTWKPIMDFYFRFEKSLK